MHIAVLTPPADPFRNAPSAHTKPALRDVIHPTKRCQDCDVRSLCSLPCLASDRATLLAKIISTRILLRKGETLHRAGDPFTALYAIRSGFCKTVILTESGKDQIVRYHMPGDLLGIAGICMHYHDCDVVALEDTEVCVLPHECIEDFRFTDRQFHQNLLRLLSREITRMHDLMLRLGTMGAEQKVAAFFLELSERQMTRGGSSCELVLHMTRTEIGSYLGMTLETVSRVCSSFQQDGTIQVQGRYVKLLDRVALVLRLSGSHQRTPPGRSPNCGVGTSALLAV